MIFPLSVFSFPFGWTTSNERVTVRLMSNRCSGCLLMRTLLDLMSEMNSFVCGRRLWVSCCPLFWKFQFELRKPVRLCLCFSFSFARSFVRWFDGVLHCCKTANRLTMSASVDCNCKLYLFFSALLATNSLSPSSSCIVYFTAVRFCRVKCNLSDCSNDRLGDFRSHKTDSLDRQKGWKKNKIFFSIHNQKLHESNRCRVRSKISVKNYEQIMKNREKFRRACSLKSDKVANLFFLFLLFIRFLANKAKIWIPFILCLFRCLEIFAVVVHAYSLIRRGNVTFTIRVKQT